MRTEAAPASLRRRIANAPHASPRMNADSISSNECVADAEHQRQHPDPADLVDERRDRGAEAHGEEQPCAASSESGTSAAVVRRGTGAASPATARRVAPRLRVDDEHERRATTRLIIAAASSVPGSPDEPDEHEAGESTPAAAPRLFAKYSSESVLPARSGMRRTHARAHQRERRAEQDRLRQDEQRGERPLGERVRDARPERGKERVVGEVRRPRRTRRGRRGRCSPTASSTIAYQSSGSRSARCGGPTTSAPADMPPRKITRTRTCAYALWPTNSPR